MSQSSLRLPSRKMLATTVTLLLSASALHPSLTLAVNRPVTNCNGDTSSGSLRAVIATAQSTDIVDLSTLSCTIRPDSSIVIAINDLTLQGPVNPNQTVVIDGVNAGAAGLFSHNGSGTLSLNDLTIINGVSGLFSTTGGCVFSAGNVSLSRSTISNCLTQGGGLNTNVEGGGIFATGNVSIIDSTVSGNRAIHNQFQIGFSISRGGGIFAGRSLIVLNSTIRDNTADDTSNADAFGGGIFVFNNGTVNIENSTISGNQADVGGGIDTSSNTIIRNSTISGNSATRLAGAINTSASLDLSNSTVAFNKSATSAGVLMRFSTLSLTSSIIANNRAAGVASDLSVSNGGSIDVNSANNLIVAPDNGINIPNTITSCPLLEPLANNGGATKTHALHSGSPAINAGAMSVLSFDQRDNPFSRAVGAVDIGAYERQANATDERIFFSGFESGCDE